MGADTFVCPPFKPKILREKEVTMPAEIIAALNEILEAERAGKELGLAMYRDAKDPVLQVIADMIAKDEGRHCAWLEDCIESYGGRPSKKTGNFLREVMALPTWPERFRLLSRGQTWVSQKAKALLTRELNPKTKVSLIKILANEERNSAWLKLKAEERAENSL